MSLPQSPVVVISVDGLDWQLLQQLVDEGDMPFCQQLVENGSSGRISIPPPHSSASVWSTIATGVLADQHGVCHDFEVRDDGLTVQSISSNALKVEPFWRTAMAAGKSVRVAGWPATLPATLNSEPDQGSCIVANGFEHAQPGGELCWPASPDIIAPVSERAAILDLRVHPSDLDSSMVLPLVTKACRDAGMTNTAAGLLAELASIHNVGTMWAEQSDWDLLVLRFDILPRWLTASSQQKIACKNALQPWYSYLDLMIGRYMALAGRQANIILVSDHGLAPKHNTQADNMLGVKAAGSIIMCGPGIPADQLLRHSSGLDICPTILSLLGLPISLNLKGQALVSSCEVRSTTQSVSNLSLAQLIKPPQIDSASIDWLQQQGYRPANLSPLTNIVNKVQAETMAGWAAIKFATGNREQAIETLQMALALQPNNLSLRLSLAGNLLEAGRADNCKALVNGLPATAKGGIWPDVFASLFAIAEQNWSLAEQHLLKLTQSDECPINAQGWLGHCKLKQQHWREAIQYYQAACNGPGEPAAYYQGLGNAHMQLAEFSQALAAFSNAVACQPFNPRFLVNRAQAYQELGESQLGEQDLWRAISLEPTLTSTHSQLANLIASSE